MKLSTLKKSLSYMFAGGILVFASCKKDRLPAVDPQPTGTKGVYVLCEGNYTDIPGTNNSTITYFDLSSSSLPEKDFLKKQNGISLGTNATDLKQYGSKMYCVITGTAPANKDSYVEVINIATGKSLKRIPFSDASHSFQARYVTFYKNKAYVSGYDGYITKIDTASMNIESRIKVGGAMEQMAVVNGKLYVVNSAHFKYGTDNNSSVSVVDLNTFTKLKDIAVTLNPTKIAATGAGDLFVVAKGNYASQSFDRLSSITDTKISSTTTDKLESVYGYGEKGFVITDFPYTLKTFNPSTGALGSLYAPSGTVFKTPYDVVINPLNGDTYVTDAVDYGDGRTLCFGIDGTKRFEFSTGIIPRSPVFNYSYN